MKDTTTTIDEMIEQFAMAQKRLEPTITTAQFKQALLQWHKDKARSYVLEVIGGDEDKYADVPDYAMMKPVYHIRNVLRAEQRAKLDQTLKAIEALGLTSKDSKNEDTE